MSKVPTRSAEEFEFVSPGGSAAPARAPAMSTTKAAISTRVNMERGYWKPRENASCLKKGKIVESWVRSEFSRRPYN
jgi:hypothetical protein